MKIKNKVMPIDRVLSLPREKRPRPKKPARFFRWLLKTVSAGDLKNTNFTFTAEGMERLQKDEPALFLMNHSSFIDLKIAATILYPRPFNIVCTSDGFVGKKALMRAIDYVHKPASSYSLYSDFYWYELGDVICIGTPGILYYCFPEEAGDVVAKTRLATEELYKLQVTPK